MGEEVEAFRVLRSTIVEKLISYEADVIYSCLLILFFPLSIIFSIASKFLQQAKAATDKLKSAGKKLAKAPSAATRRIEVLIKRFCAGLTAAVYAAILLATMVILAAAMGISLVWMWAEEPIYISETLQFDYTEANPQAVFLFSAGTWRKKGVPLGHTLHITIELSMPESNYNTEMGIFMLSAELMSSDERVITKSGQPCILRFRGRLVRFLRAALLSIPELLGIASETQRISVEILKHKERRRPRTESVRIRLAPRAGMHSLPQVYESHIIIMSKAPWLNRTLRSWRWTFSVWVSLYIYIALLLTLLSRSKSFVFLGRRTQDEKD